MGFQNLVLATLCVMPFINPLINLPTGENLKEAQEFIQSQPTYPEDEAYVLVKLNIREKPDGVICGQYKQGDKVKILEYQGDWAKTEEGYCWAGFLAENYCGKYKIKYDSEEASKYVGSLYKEYVLIPENLRSLLKNYEIKLTSERISCDLCAPEERIIAGKTTVTQNKKKIEIYVSNKENIHFAFLHELGHAIDLYKKENEIIPSDTQEFSDILKEEKDILKNEFDCDKQNLVGNDECFAEAIRLYIEDKEKLNEKAPSIYDYVEKTISRI